MVDNRHRIKRELRYILDTDRFNNIREELPEELNLLKPISPNRRGLELNPDEKETCSSWEEMIYCDGKRRILKILKNKNNKGQGFVVIELNFFKNLTVTLTLLNPLIYSLIINNSQLKRRQLKK